MPRFQLCDQRIADFVHIPDNAIGTIPENGSVRIFVYGDDHIRIEDSGHMVDRAGDAEGQVYFRLDDDAGLSYYQLVWQDPSVKDGACTGKLSAQELCQFPISRERIGTLQTISDTDNVFGIRYVQRFVKLRPAKSRSPLSVFFQAENQNVLPVSQMRVLLWADI